MDNIPFQPLDILENKPIPKKMEEIRIGIKKELNEEEKRIEEEKSDKPEKPELEEEITELAPRVKTKIVDKRRTSNIDRDEILNRIRGQLSVSVLDPSLKPAQPKEQPSINRPVKTDKRVVIQKKIEEPIVEEDEQGEEETKQDEEEVPEKDEEEIPKKKVETKPVITTVPDVDLTAVAINGQNVIERLPSDREKVIVKAPSYYMNNRKIFIQKLTEMFKPYRKSMLDVDNNISCDQQRQNTDFDLLTHQKIVRDYLNLYTPYRGVLLYHGLGSGKTCSSIALAEGMKSDKHVFVLTPASLKMNFFSEMKKCGDELYKKNQFWEFVSTEGKPEYLPILAKALSVPADYVKKHKGAWLVNIKKEPNFTDLDTEEQNQIDEQLNHMIRSKYTDINYNGLNANKMEKLTENYSKNPFDNAVVVIDEAHNFVSRIVNKMKSKKSISYNLYEYLMSANNARIILLTGTPIINYPNEIGILYNILRGYIKSWTIPITWDKADKLNLNTILTTLDKGNLKTHDYVNFSDNKLQITRNPFGFINVKKRGVAKGTRRKIKGGRNKTAKKLSFESEPISQEESIEYASRIGPNQHFDLYKGGNNEMIDKYNGVKLDNAGNISDDQFIQMVVKILQKSNMKINEKNITETLFKALPDDKDNFLHYFVNIEDGITKDLKLFQRRILGLTSYFRSAQEDLLPSYVETESGKTYHIVKAEMSDHQFGIYQKIRHQERDKEKKAKTAKRMGKDDDLFSMASSYRIFSRACCNFAFPNDIDRPEPNLKVNQEIDENTLDVIPGKGAADSPIEDDELVKYETRIERAMNELNKDDSKGNKEYLNKRALMTYSPKFTQILENLLSPENKGLHLLYSHFRTIEGIGVIRLILLANGFSEFKIQKNNDTWEMIEEDDDIEKPKFVLYTGTESIEEKEIIRNVYNGNWDYVPASISSKLMQKAENNNMGEVIKIMMITSSGAEGINLKNTRFVHIVEPYWHMVRVEQVVGRARRICSHQDLPPDMRNVKVFLYVSTLSDAQRTDKNNNELINHDVSRIDKKTTVTTDENLYEISSIKQKINNQFLHAVKESAVDCNLYSASANKKGEEMVCYGHGKVDTNAFSSHPSLEVDANIKDDLNIKKVTWKTQKITYNNKDYVLNLNTNEVYNFESYQNAVQTGNQPMVEGYLVNNKIEFM